MNTHIHVPMPKSWLQHKSETPPVRNANSDFNDSLSKLDKAALFITDHVGTMGFFMIIFLWTIIWCGFNILATSVSGLHWKPFDPFPAFVAYLLISNVIQIMLMPLIMVGQNLQGRHSEQRAQSDYEINCKAESEVELILHHLEYQNSILISMLEKLGLSADQAKMEIQAHGPDA